MPQVSVSLMPTGASPGPGLMGFPTLSALVSPGQERRHIAWERQEMELRSVEGRMELGDGEGGELAISVKGPSRGGKGTA